MNRTAEEVGLLRDETALTNWRKATGQDLPKLILVATTGGAYRASFWTTVVLDELTGGLGPDFHRHIRLITGASGGMVGAAYFVAALTERRPARKRWGYRTAPRGERARQPHTRGPPVSPRRPAGTFWPFAQHHDRGIELERQWTTLDKTFTELSEGERAGWRPSLDRLADGRRVRPSAADQQPRPEPAGRGQTARTRLGAPGRP